MPALFTFLFKVNIALVLFCLGYCLVLRHLTFYTLNRVYLVAAILFSSIYPWINISGFLQQHQQLTAPVQHAILQWKAPAENLVKPLERPDYWQLAEGIFWAGAIVLAIRLLLQLYSLYRLYRNSEPGYVQDYAVRIIDGDVSPFSFWRSIYVNPDNLAPNDLEKVLEHEQVHVSEWHTIDILLAELSTVFYWFNPGVWLMKKAVRENIEFITDRKILRGGVDSKQYQYSLLNVSMAGSPNKLVNNFNMSTIKKRIIMMNAKRSSRLNLGRYMFVAPAVVILLLVFSISKAEITKKGLNSFKSITTAITNIHITGADKPVLPQSKHLKPAPKTTGYAIKNGDTIYAGKSKDGKHNMMLTSDKSVDSVTYIINGAKSTRADLLALDPGNIISLDYIPADRAKKYVDFMIDHPDVLFVTTRDSETGKKLKARFDKDMGGGKLAIVNNMSLKGRSDVTPEPPVSANIAYSAATVSSDVAPSANTAVTVNGVSSDVTPEVYVLDDKMKKPVTVKNKIFITAKPKVATNLKLDKVYTISPKADVLITVDSNGVERKNYVYKDKPFVYKIRPNNDETTIDRFGNDVLYIVDGKEVKNLKKVSGDDIRSITVLRDGKAREEYGDKGKNGVIVIRTKNAKD